jgi:hypothetical protein
VNIKANSLIALLAYNWFVAIGLHRFDFEMYPCLNEC